MEKTKNQFRSEILAILFFLVLALAFFALLMIMVLNTP